MNAQENLTTRNVNSAEFGNLALKRQKVRKWQQLHNDILVFEEVEISSEGSLINIASRWFSHVPREELPRTLLAYLLCLERKKKNE